MAFKPKYKFPKLNAGDDSYSTYFTNEFKRRRLDEAYSWSTNEKRGSQFLKDLIDENSCKDFLTDNVFVIIRNRETKKPVYYFLVDREFWYERSKVRDDHDFIQTIAGTHLDKLADSIKWT